MGGALWFALAMLADGILMSLHWFGGMSQNTILCLFGFCLLMSIEAVGSRIARGLHGRL